MAESCPGDGLPLSARLLIAFTICFIGKAWRLWLQFGQPNGLDFVTFWSASRLTLDGTPLLAYSQLAITEAAQNALPHIMMPGAWSYPPNYPLVVWPLALGALLLLEQRPVWAGICIGLLSIKPHLAVLFPVVLACAGMWTAFIAAAATVLAFTGVSVAVFGTAVVPAFLHAVGVANGYLAHDGLPLQETASLFAALRALHLAVWAAYAAQACLAVMATLATAWVWRTSQALEIRHGVGGRYFHGQPVSL